MKVKPRTEGYGGEPFKITAKNRAGERLVVGWTRDPMDAAEMRKIEHRLTAGSWDADIQYRDVRNRKTGDT